MAAKGPKQSPEEAAAPQLPEVEHSPSPPPSSLVDVDNPSVRTVPSDFLDQDVQTTTQASRIEREEQALANATAAEAKKKRHARSTTNENPIALWILGLSESNRNAFATGNVALVVGVGAIVGYRVWGLYEAGNRVGAKVNWGQMGILGGVFAAVLAGEAVIGRWIAAARK